MLTDYHLHLRPDDPGTDAAEYFTAANADRYRSIAEQHGIAELGCSEHIYRFVQALEVWRHPLWRESATDDLDDYAAFVREQTDLRLGIEADYIAGREDRLATLLDAHDWDYVVGSVHFVGEHAVDHDGYEVWDHRSERPDELWRRYFVTLGEAARCGLFDILAHPDLVKIWGPSRPVPEGDLRRFYELAMDGHRGVADRRRGLDGGAAQAGRRALSGARVSRDVPRGRLPRRALQRRPRARRRRPRLRARARAARRRSACASSRSSNPASGGWSRSGDAAGQTRSGLGWDSHRFKAGRRLILGGVEFADAELGLDGHSDADVLTHAVMDALLGAAGLGDIGVLLPRHRRRLRGRGLDRAAARGRRGCRRRGLAGRARRHDGADGAPEGGPASRRDPRAAGGRARDRARRRST